MVKVWPVDAPSVPIAAVPAPGEKQIVAMRMSLPPPEDHVRGAAEGRVTLLEYGDYQCPRCAGAEPAVAAILLRHPADLRFVFRHFPAAEAHPMAALAAEAAEYAGMHGRFWPMHAALLANAHRVSLALLFALARQLGLSADRFRDALAIGLCAERVRRDVTLGMADGVDETPAFFIDGRRHRHAPIGPTLEAMIDSAVKAAPRQTLHIKVKSEER
jgi:protein-disulfide isomerase